MGHVAMAIYAPSGSNLSGNHHVLIVALLSTNTIFRDRWAA
jgi:hypothetical protein